MKLTTYSSVSQDSVLDQILLMICIYDIKVGLNNLITKFEDDTKRLETPSSRIKTEKHFNKIYLKFQIGLINGKCPLIYMNVEFFKLRQKLEGFSLMKCIV